MLQLKDAINKRKEEIPTHKELQAPKKTCNKKKEKLACEYKKQNNTLLHEQAHEIKITFSLFFLGWRKPKLITGLHVRGW